MLLKSGHLTNQDTFPGVRTSQYTCTTMVVTVCKCVYIYLEREVRMELVIVEDIPDHLVEHGEE